MKKCPFCAEEIQDAAIKCRYCGSQLNAPPESVTTMPAPSRSSGTPSLPAARRFNNVTESDARLIEEGAVIELRVGGSISQRAEQLLADKHVTVLRPAAAATVSGAATVPSSDGWHPGKNAPPQRAPSANTATGTQSDKFEGVSTGFALTVMASGCLVLPGLLLTLTGVGAILGIPLMLIGVAVLFVGIPLGFLVGRGQRKGPCPYCGHSVSIMGVAADCPVCKKRIVVKDKQFTSVDS